MEELMEMALAKFRVDKGEGGFWAVAMTKDEAARRRCFIRGLLKNRKQWRNLSNDELDNVRVYKMGDTFVLEDAEFYTYAL